MRARGPAIAQAAVAGERWPKPSLPSVGPMPGSAHAVRWLLAVVRPGSKRRATATLWVGLGSKIAEALKPDDRARGAFDCQLKRKIAKPQIRNSGFQKPTAACAGASCSRETVKQPTGKGRSNSSAAPVRGGLSVVSDIVVPFLFGQGSRRGHASDKWRAVGLTRFIDKSLGNDIVS